MILDGDSFPARYLSKSLPPRNSLARKRIASVLGVSCDAVFERGAAKRGVGERVIVRVLRERVALGKDLKKEKEND